VGALARVGRDWTAAQTTQELDVESLYHTGAAQAIKWRIRVVVNQNEKVMLLFFENKLSGLKVVLKSFAFFLLFVCCVFSLRSFFAVLLIWLCVGTSPGVPVSLH
jgi:hypothetical protein